MASKRRPPYGTVRSLYGELEHARREWEENRASEGGKSFELWLELLDVADWCAGTTDASDDDDDEPSGEGDATDVDGGDAGPCEEGENPPRRPAPSSGDGLCPTCGLGGEVDKLQPPNQLPVRGVVMDRTTRRMTNMQVHAVETKELPRRG